MQPSLWFVCSPAVIPSVFVMGPIAVLAALFPAVFGGLLLFFRRWIAVITFASLSSTVLWLFLWLSPKYPAEWWMNATNLWLGTVLLGVLCMMWAWRRHSNQLREPPIEEKPDPEERTDDEEVDEPERTTPPLLAPTSKGELIFLGGVSAALIGVAIWLSPTSLAKFTFTTKMLALYCIGLWMATLYLLVSKFVSREERSSTLTGEGVMLSTVVLVGVLFMTTFSNHSVSGGSAAGAKQGETTAESRLVKFKGVAWKFQPPGRGRIASSPLVDGDNVYIGVVQLSDVNVSGAMYCLDRNTGKIRWTFNDDGNMLDSFSTPTLADGHLYFGEGFHQHFGCKLYCVDVTTGKKKWHYQTSSHTEGKPTIVDGKVYFSAGDDGLLCLETKSGKVVWHVQGYHIDTMPLVADGKVFCGSGKGDIYRETAIFAFDAKTGKELWKMPTEVPVWSGADYRDGKVYIGIGNGNFLMSEQTEAPVGAVLCLGAEKGNRIWRFDAKDGVHTRIQVDFQHVYFGARDSLLYCLDRATGKKIWSRSTVSPCVATPAIARCSHCGANASIYAIGSYGHLVCVDPRDGSVQYSFDALQGVEVNGLALFVSSPAVAVTKKEGVDHRQVFFGADLDNHTDGCLYCIEDEMRIASPK